MKTNYGKTVRYKDTAFIKVSGVIVETPKQYSQGYWANEPNVVWVQWEDETSPKWAYEEELYYTEELEKASIGDIIKVFDFVGEENCYHIFRVLSIDKTMLECRVIKRVWMGTSYNSNDVLFIAQHGELELDSAETPRIIVLG